MYSIPPAICNWCCKSCIYPIKSSKIHYFYIEYLEDEYLCADCVRDNFDEIHLLSNGDISTGYRIMIFAQELQIVSCDGCNQEIDINKTFYSNLLHAFIDEEPNTNDYCHPCWNQLKHQPKTFQKIWNSHLSTDDIYE